MKERRLTKGWLLRRGACKEEVERFNRMYPRGVVLSARVVKTLAGVCRRSSFAWLIETACGREVYREYGRHDLSFWVDNFGLILTYKRAKFVKYFMKFWRRRRYFKGGKRKGVKNDG